MGPVANQISSTAVVPDSAEKLLHNSSFLQA